MKILKVIVDKLPLSACRCDLSSVTWNPIIFKEIVNCKIGEEYLSMTENEYFSTRCPDCPLALADGLMDSHGAAFSELAKGTE